MVSSRLESEPAGRAAHRLGALCAAALLFGLAVRLPAQDHGAVRLTWAILQRGSDGMARPIDCTPEVIHLKAGDRIRIWMKPVTDGWFYLYLHDAQKRLTQLFPADLRQAGVPARAGAGGFVPGSDMWFRLDGKPGTEVLYLILSDRRLDALEAATIAGGEARRATGSRPLDRPSEALEEIGRLIVASSSLVRPAEKPVPVAGDFRGLEVESGVEGILIEARGLYVRTFRLEH